MSVSFDNVATLQSANSHQCSRDADGNGERGRNGYPSDSMKATLTEKFYVAEREDHDQTGAEEFDSGEAPCPTSDEDDSDEEEADSSDGEGAGATFAHNSSSNETARTSRRDEQDSQVPGALVAAFIKHTKFAKKKQLQICRMPGNERWSTRRV